ncbi:GntR family transcriptional regulator [Desulfovibrio inopinatus]|uniref:GntR family transcriptional regulator n=1 Tax=Desulfovibrio inopinatus TaxID=102109 RepID=UPI0003F7298F|nr:GntR family transcriptional regulator [Desulfovibrio inopinatus]
MAWDGNTKKNGRVTFVDKAYAIIKENILSVRYPPGYQVLEAQLADDLGMSRTPVREALIRLSDEGLVEIVPRRGVRVVPLSAADMSEISEVLTSLEVTAVEKAAKVGLEDEASSALEALLKEMEDALDNDDLDTWAEADARFHQMLLSLSGNSVLTAIGASLTDKAHRARLLTLRLRPKPERSNREHREVVEAMRRGDSERAGRSHRAHRERAADIITQILEYYRLNHV